MRSVRGAATAALIVCASILPIVAGGCSGDGDDGGGVVGQVIITITNCDATTFAADGVVCVDFTATGPAGVFDLLAQFIGGTFGPLENALEVPPALAQQLGITTNAQNYVLQFDGDTVSGRFCWFAGADLGFVAAFGVQFFLTPVADGTSNPVGPAASCTGINYGGGGATQTGTGPPIGSLPGRAAHCGENVGGKNIMIAGGYTSSGAAFATYQTADRFTFDTSTFTYTKNAGVLAMRDLRYDHACSFFLDPLTEAIKVLMTGGATASPPGSPAVATADVYCFTPVATDTIMSTSGDMNVARRGHTATWTHNNQVVIIGGEVGGTGAGLSSIEIYDPVLDNFQLIGTTLSSPRRGHTATLLPSGKILIAGGFNPAATTTDLPAELFDPSNQSIMVVAGPTVDRVNHTATRLTNGWVLLAGGNRVTTGIVTDTSQIFEPELGGMGSFTATIPLMTTARAFHGASLLGNGNALISGGETATGPPFVTSSAELFLYQALTFTPTISMNTPRAEHSSDATDCGAIIVIGGRNDVGGTQNFLSTLEFFPFSNTNPVVGSAFTGVTGIGGTVFILITVEDADADGGYVIIRFRTPAGTGMFRQATIDQQVPSTAGGTFPNMEVSGLPGSPQPYSFRWNFAADGLSSGQIVEVEVLPVGATLGTPIHFITTLP